MSQNIEYLYLHSSIDSAAIGAIDETYFFYLYLRF